jgi:hypothetical protein
MSNYTKTEGGNDVDILTDYAKTSDVSSTYATKAYVETLGILSTVNLASNVTGILPIANGGTGATTMANALSALGGLSSVNLASNVTDTLPIANGGTGKTTNAEALAALGGLSSVNLASNVTGILPIGQGGTGTDVANVFNNFGIHRRILQFSTFDTYNLIYEGSINESITNVNWNSISYDGGGYDSVTFRYTSSIIRANSIILATYRYPDGENTTGVTLKLYNQINYSVYVNLMAPIYHNKFPNNGSGKHFLYMIIINN